MAELTERERELVAIGASIGSNCVPCIAFHVGQAREAGLSPELIEAAIALAEEIRAIPAELVVNTARAHLGANRAGPQQASGGDCTPGCCG